MRIVRVAALGFCLLSVFVGTARAAYPGTNGRIAFTRADGYIYSAQPAGTGLQKLGLGEAPSYSPNGTRIAFDLNGEIWTMNADGSNRQQVTHLASYEHDPTWSPDGTRIAFASDRNGGGIFALHSSAPYGTLTRIEATPPPSFAFGYVDSTPAWSTSGLIYFTRSTFDNEGFCDDWVSVLTVNAATKAVVQRVQLGQEPDPGPGGKAFAYQEWEGPDGCTISYGLTLANADGTHPRTLTPLRDVQPLDARPAFSPDGTRLTFQRGRYVYTINPDGTGLKRVIVGSDPTWQPR